MAKFFDVLKTKTMWGGAILLILDAIATQMPTYEVPIRHLMEIVSFFTLAALRHSQAKMQAQAVAAAEAAKKAEFAAIEASEAIETKRP